MKRNSYEHRSKLASKLQVLWGLQLGPLISMDQTSLVENALQQQVLPLPSLNFLRLLMFLLIFLLLSLSYFFPANLT